jgi:hypothetical protein
MSINRKDVEEEGMTKTKKDVDVEVEEMTKTRKDVVSEGVTKTQNMERRKE